MAVGHVCVVQMFTFVLLRLRPRRPAFNVSLVSVSL